jgi:hypothetical protein
MSLFLFPFFPFSTLRLPVRYLSAQQFVGGLFKYHTGEILEFKGGGVAILHTKASYGATNAHVRFSIKLVGNSFIMTDAHGNVSTFVIASPQRVNEKDWRGELGPPYDRIAGGHRPKWLGESMAAHCMHDHMTNMCVECILNHVLLDSVRSREGN